jgi:hypothetical protein
MCSESLLLDHTLPAIYAHVGLHGIMVVKAQPFTTVAMIQLWPISEHIVLSACSNFMLAALPLGVLLKQSNNAEVED